MRINCIKPEYLSDQHLRAEWLEILLLPPYIRRSLKSKKGFYLSDSKEYTLNAGHARFFYDKLEYVEKRYKAIGDEMIRRGYNINYQLDLSEFDRSLYNDWNPTATDVAINLSRILSRINMKPMWYTYEKNRVDNWTTFYDYRLDNY